jgi:hydrophobe/amphiphile efflux-3 (HAE3) family protein
MLKGDWFASVVRFAVRKPAVVLGIVGVLVFGGALLAATQLSPSSSTDSLVGEGSDAYAATERFKQEFGDEAVVILAQGELQKLVLTKNLEQFVTLEGCIGGNPPKEGGKEALAKLPAPCKELAELKPARAVYGPGTFVNTAISGAQDFLAGKTSQIKAAGDAARKASKDRGDSPAKQEELGRAAENLAQQEVQAELLRLYLRYNIANPASLEFIAALIFDGSKGAGEPKQRFAYLFPSKDAAMITVRLRPDLTDEERSRAIELIKQATGDKRFALDEGKWTVSGVPVVVEGLANSVENSIFVLLGVALLVMALALALVFRTRMRLLPLALALGSASIVYGGLALLGGKLTMASIAVLPVLIGLAVDYSIQFQARFDEQRRLGRDPVLAATAAARAGGPTIATASLATAAGMSMLLLSPVPMVRDFGVMLVFGVLVAFAVAITAGFALLSLGASRWSAESRVQSAGSGSRTLHSALRTPVDRLRSSRLLRWLNRRARLAFEYSLRKPKRVLGIATAIALVGIVASFFHEVTSDVRELVPQDLPALKDANTLQAATGISGELDITVEAPDLTDPAVLAWMTRFQEKVLKDHGYVPGTTTCRQKENPPELCPALSLPDLFRSGVPNQQGVRDLLAAVPDYFSQAVVSRDPKTRTPRVANLAFGIRLMPLDRQQEVVDDIRAAIDDPALKKPKGVEAEVAGLPVLAAEANAKLASPWWRLGTLVGSLLLVFLVLWLLARRRVRTAIVPLIPVALATGWSGAVLFALQIPLNPMSVTLSALVVAIATEFSVLLSARYTEERARGVGPVVALERTYASTGAAVIASGVTAIAGFAVLIASDISMLRQFGISTVVDLTVALVGVLLVLPAALIFVEDHGPLKLSDLDPRPLLRAAAGGVKRAPRAVASGARRVRRGRKVPARFSLRRRRA